MGDRREKFNGKQSGAFTLLCHNKPNLRFGINQKKWRAKQEPYGERNDIKILYMS